ncbi:hypothetical protein B484DRAFT_29079 [Ochromonadaceae sp. CCMP2298]|nr:hypothetical protein B484DRAFT_29079 [Ochromonadaceae sp. CCMP2298]
MYYQKEYDADIECRPSFEQISHDRILHEAGKNLSILKALENVVTDRLNGFNAFSASRSRPPSYELLENVGGSLRLGLDSLFVYAEQEQLQSRQQLFLSDLRKSLTQMRLDASRRVSDYQREINSAEKEVGLAEKKLHKSKEQERGDYKSKLESFELDVLLGTSRYKKEGREHRDRDRDRDRQEEAQSRQLRHEREVKDDVRALLRAIEHRDQVLSASRRAFQKLHGECHRAAQLTLRRVSEKEREMQDARMEALEKLERCVGGVDVDTDECNFIHACGGQGALALSSQALSLLGDLMPQGAGQGGQGQGGLQRVLSSDSLSSKNSNASPDHSCPTSPTALTPPVPPAAAPTSTPKTSSTSTSAPTSVPTSGPGDMYVTINSLRNLDSVRGSQDTHSADTHTQGRPPSPHSSIPSATSPPSPPSPTLPSPSDQSAPSPASRPTRVSGISIVSAVSAEARRGGGGDQGNNGNQGNRQGNKADLSVTVSTDRGRVTQADFTAYLSQIFYTPGNTPAPQRRQAQ